MLKGIITIVIVSLIIGISFWFFISGYRQKPVRNSNYTYTIPPQLHDGITTADLTSAGFDRSKIIELTQLILTDTFPNIHSLLIAKDNQLVYENYFAGKDEILGKNLGYIDHTMDDLHDCRSISKGIVSACIGIAVKQGLIKNIDEPIRTYFTAYEKEFDTSKSKITLRHLLTMTSGLDWNEDISYMDLRNSEMRMDLSSDPIGFILSRSMISEPGTQWNYNGGGTQLLAEILHKVSGETVDKFAEKNLFFPLGIKKHDWLPLTKDMPAAASGLRLRSRDILKIGLLYMNNGNWNNVQILTESWVKESLSPLAVRPAGRKPGGYGFQFWTYTDTVKNKAIDIQEAKGNGEQRIFFCKSLNLCIVMTAGNYNQWDIVNNSHAALVQYIIPALK
jgi:CubicO group peptidase (beta-lactamase class C family)